MVLFLLRFQRATHRVSENIDKHAHRQDLLGMNLNLTPIVSEQLSPAEFLKLFETERSAIKSIKINPAMLGSSSSGEDNFGSLEVEYKTPQYRVVFEREE